MKTDLKQFARLREPLISEKVTIEGRLRELDEVMGAEPAQATAAPVSPSLDKMAAEYLERELGYVPRKGTLPSKVLKALEKNGSSMAVKNIAGAIKGKPMLVNQACLLLLKKGRLKRQGRGQYEISPGDGAWEL